MRIGYYFQIWWMLSLRSFYSTLTQRGNFFIFLFGKLLRFVIYLAFIFYLLQGTGELAGYSKNQVIFFFLTFSIVDVFAQFLFREVYRFRPQIMDGSFDLVLTKPMSSLFRSLLSGADIMDLALLPVLLVFSAVFGSSFQPSLGQVIIYILLVGNGVMISAAFHIFVLGFAIITFEMDHTIMVYRDFVSLGRFPIDIYQEPVRSALTFFIPIAVMVWIPARAMMGLAQFEIFIISFLVGIVFVVLSLRFWKYALTKYSSASS